MPHLGPPVRRRNAVGRGSPYPGRPAAGRPALRIPARQALPCPWPGHPMRSLRHHGVRPQDSPAQARVGGDPGGPYSRHPERHERRGPARACPGQGRLPSPVFRQAGLQRQDPARVPAWTRLDPVAQGLRARHGPPVRVRPGRRRSGRPGYGRRGVRPRRPRGRTRVRPARPAPGRRGREARPSRRGRVRVRRAVQDGGPPGRAAPCASRARGARRLPDRSPRRRVPAGTPGDRTRQACAVRPGVSPGPRRPEAAQAAEERPETAQAEARQPEEERRTATRPGWRGQAGRRVLRPHPEPARTSRSRPRRARRPRGPGTAAWTGRSPPAPADPSATAARPARRAARGDEVAARACTGPSRGPRPARDGTGRHPDGHRADPGEGTGRDRRTSGSPAHSAAFNRYTSLAAATADLALASSRPRSRATSGSSWSYRWG
ncbi:hypothetical protein FHX40_3940 [Thermopolyspora flexuosa]|uniref:Uncharacterized protein n=1 Tax=Thermopolyspora flexuosa TaxID=103836 RepID=A0A543J2Z6_9ACTN|nr:hypothetical protein FHX40_3940 [Thermopolyspora flexuosa]